jgi:hypothetical protein
MPLPRLNLRAQSDSELRLYAKSVIDAMRNNIYFGAHSVMIETAAQAVDAFGQSVGKHLEMKNLMRAATIKKGMDRKKAEKALSGLAALVAAVSAGNADVIISSQMKLRKKRTPLGQLSAPGNLLANITEFEGTCALRWERVRGASVYEIEFKLKEDEAPWQRFQTVTAAKAEVSGLIGGQFYYFRVRAIGAAGPGAWSDLALRRAP